MKPLPASTTGSPRRACDAWTRRTSRPWCPGSRRSWTSLSASSPSAEGALALRRRRARSGSGWRSSSANWFTACACRPRCPRAYEVVFCEHPIEVADGVDFAGVRLRGRVDRVDADAERGRFVVIDYKGSSKDYASGLKEGDEPSVPHHVQGLIYAQALLRTDLGLACAGALYLGYRARVPRNCWRGPTTVRPSTLRACLPEARRWP